jgi:phosphatidylinositol alpha 1,6-mannosyltransferase
MSTMSLPVSHHRIAYFPDSFHEVNGVAHTSRNFAAYAQRHGIPMLCVRAGKTTQVCAPTGTVEALELGRSALAVQLERDLYFDPLFFRYSALISHTVRAFRPDVIHITGPSELGIFGAYFAWKLGVPLAASWHTNVHEYGARRLQWLTHSLGGFGASIEHGAEAGILEASARFYRLAKVLYAPNPELCTLLERKTCRPCHLMERGVETDIFTPTKRTRPPLDPLTSGTSHLEADTRPVLGYVGRLSVEKNVALLPKIDAELRQRGIHARWLIVGHGSEEPMLRAALGDAAMAGVLRGETLAEAYANMDLFVFPSHTDTFGNVVLEALASGVPAIVTPDGGPAHIVADHVTGRVARDGEFSAVIAETLAAHDPFATMRSAARAHAMQCSWDAVFDRVVGAYPLP